MTTMRISQLAERVGVPATTLRFYESAGLLPAGRSEAGYRLYGEDAVRRLAFIDAGKHLGLPLEEIAELLVTWESGACAQVKADLRPRIVSRLAEAEHRAAELDAFTSTLRGALDHLDALPDSAEPCGPQCAFLDAPAEAERWRTAPVACALTGDGMRERAAQWRDALDGAIRTVIPDGVRLTMPVDRAAVVVGLAADEQDCCPFFDFRLHLDGPRLHLEVRAPSDGSELLENLFAQSG
jgi:DNA-binding transcriptional MerR regulator